MFSKREQKNVQTYETTLFSNTRLRYFTRIPWRHAPPLPHTMLSEYLGNVSPNTTLKWGDGGEILTLTVGDVKIVTLVGQCPNNFVQDCLSI